MRIHHATAAKAKKFQITLTVEDNEIIATSKVGVRLAAGLHGNKVLEDAITRMTGKVAKGAKLAEIVQNEIAAARAIKPAKVPAVVDEYETAAKEEGWKKSRWGFSKDGEESIRANNWADLCGQAGIEVEIDELDAEDEETGTRSIVKSKYKERYKPTKHRCGDELGDKVTAHVLRENDDGEMRIDVAALRKFSKANGVWVEGYASFKSRTGAANTGMMRMNVLNRLRAKIRHAMKEDPKLDVNKFVVWA